MPYLALCKMGNTHQPRAIGIATGSNTEEMLCCQASPRARATTRTFVRPRFLGKLGLTQLWDGYDVHLLTVWEICRLSFNLL
jgi:hypothetical protein